MSREHDRSTPAQSASVDPFLTAAVHASTWLTARWVTILQLAAK
jgi:hypothetical protein